METRLRSFIKALSWRITGTADTFVVSWFLTGAPSLAATIAITEIVTKITLYWLHERAWNNSKWGVKPIHEIRENKVDAKPIHGHKSKKLSQSSIVAYRRNF